MERLGAKQDNLLKRIYMVFKENNITIPFPQMDVHLEKVLVPDSEFDDS